ncbi:hypothetical protein Lal_00030376 [Lupinus albus]|nr:hypothetical protein Lal_00030376 [Lupinus albus]
MVHLSIHLVREIQLCGPSYMRWMYPFERYMKILKGYVNNRARRESCIAKRYIVEETLDFFIGYLEDGDFIGIPKPRYVKGISGEGIAGKEILSISKSELEQAHLYVLHNADEVEPYVERHMEMLKNSNPSNNQNWISKEHNWCFIKWLKYHIDEELNINADFVSERLKWLAI